MPRVTPKPKPYRVSTIGRMLDYDPDEVRRMILRTMVETAGNLPATAKKLGLSVPYLRKVVRDLGLVGKSGEILRWKRAMFRLPEGGGIEGDGG